MRPDRPIVVPDRAALERHLGWYLDRYEPTRRRAVDVLRRKVRPAVRAGLMEAEAAEAMVQAVISEATDARLIDDLRAANGTVRAWRSRGKPARAIRFGLAMRGVEPEALEAAMAADEDDDATAIVRLARRKGYGPFRRGARSPEQDRKELAGLARAGFSFDAARRVVEASEAEGLEEVLRGR